MQKGIDKIQQILVDPKQLELFSQYCAKRCVSENIDFLKRVKEYEDYVSELSQYAWTEFKNVVSNKSLVVPDNLMIDMDNPSAHMFDCIKEILIQSLAENVLPKFDKSAESLELEKKIEALYPIMRNPKQRNKLSSLGRRSNLAHLVELFSCILALEDQTVESAKKLYVDFIDESSEQQVNISAREVQSIKSNLDRPSIKLYAETKIHVLKMLSTGVLQSFLDEFPECQNNPAIGSSSSSNNSVSSSTTKKVTSQPDYVNSNKLNKILGPGIPGIPEGSQEDSDLVESESPRTSPSIDQPNYVNKSKINRLLGITEETQSTVSTSQQQTKNESSKTNDKTTRRLSKPDDNTTTIIDTNAKDPLKNSGNSQKNQSSSSTTTSVDHQGEAENQEEHDAASIRAKKINKFFGLSPDENPSSSSSSTSSSSPSSTTGQKRNFFRQNRSNSESITQSFRSTGGSSSSSSSSSISPNSSPVSPGFGSKSKLPPKPVKSSTKKSDDKSKKKLDSLQSTTPNTSQFSLPQFNDYQYYNSMSSLAMFKDDHVEKLFREISEVSFPKDDDSNHGGGGGGNMTTIQPNAHIRTTIALNKAQSSVNHFFESQSSEVAMVIDNILHSESLRDSERGQKIHQAMQQELAKQQKLVMNVFGILSEVYSSALIEHNVLKDELMSMYRKMVNNNDVNMNNDTNAQDKKV
eukprot:TRINITY_DN1342_c0_g1_i1.p1 TRINITY_DN1342_c0_g1~~TRINITY_DN1342_c0_g1_i1.p1  ORF type:complete len:692 (+),score=180.51 TRINITY_DN1342_c0_g1_i1:103-2178(+)